MTAVSNTILYLPSYTFLLLTNLYHLTSTLYNLPLLWLWWLLQCQQLGLFTHQLIDMTSLFLRRIRLAWSRLTVMRLVFVDRQVVWLWRTALLWEQTLLWPMQICLMLTTTSFMAQAWPLLSSQCSHFAITCQEIDTCLGRKEKEKVISFNCGLDLRWPCCGSTPTIGIWWSQSGVMAAITVMHDEGAGLILIEWHLQGYDHTQCCCSKCHSGVFCNLRAIFMQEDWYSWWKQSLQL